MKTIITVTEKHHYLKLKCACGRKTKFHIGRKTKNLSSKTQINNQIPTHEWNGWYIKDDVVCPICYMNFALKEKI